MQRPDRTSLLALIPLLAACATSGGRPAAAASRPGDGSSASVAPTSSAVHWTRDAAEHDALAVQTYRLAGERLRGLAEGRARDSWGVILDADETILDNSQYQKDRLRAGGGFTADSWAAWVRREEADAMPGAKGFLALVHELGGRVAIVTNRDEEVCPETRENIRRLGMAVDVVLCRPPSTSDKNPRFQQVIRGTASPDLPPLAVLMWLGDNIQDFPDLSQSVRGQGDAAYAAFGDRFFVLPNPMYGSWESNPWR